MIEKALIDIFSQQKLLFQTAWVKYCLEIFHSLNKATNTFWEEETVTTGNALKWFMVESIEDELSFVSTYLTNCWNQSKCSGKITFRWTFLRYSISWVRIQQYFWFCKWSNMTGEILTSIFCFVFWVSVFLLMGSELWRNFPIYKNILPLHH